MKMRIRFPLYAKILLWFFLNLLLLAAGSYAFFRLQFHVGLDSLLAGQAGERITRLSDLVTREFAAADPKDRTLILRRISDSYGLQLFLFRPDGVELAGEAVTLPDSVRARLAEYGPQAGRRRPPPGGPPVEGERELPPPGFPERDGSNGGPPPGGQREDLRPGGEVSPNGEKPPAASNLNRQAIKFMERTTHPVRYWVGVRLPPHDPFRPNTAPPWLLAVSDTMSGGGLFFDLRSWLAIGAGAVVLCVLFWLPLVH